MNKLANRDTAPLNWPFSNSMKRRKLLHNSKLGRHLVHFRNFQYIKKYIHGQSRLILNIKQNFVRFRSALQKMILRRKVKNILKSWADRHKSRHAHFCEKSLNFSNVL